MISKKKDAERLYGSVATNEKCRKLMVACRADMIQVRLKDCVRRDAELLASRQLALEEREGKPYQVILSEFLFLRKSPRLRLWCIERRDRFIPQPTEEEWVRWNDSLKTG